MLALGSIDILVNNAGVMATPLRADRGRARPAAGHQPLRPLRSHRAAAAGTGQGRRGACRHGVLADGAHGPARVACATRALRPGHYSKWHSLRAVEAGQPAVHLRARPPCTARAGCRSSRRRPTPATPTPAWSPAGPNLGRRRIAGNRRPSRRSLPRAAGGPGALPQLMAATAPGLPGGTYCGPNGASASSAAPRRSCSPPKPALDEGMARRLWELSRAGDRGGVPLTTSAPDLSPAASRARDAT